MKDIILFGIQGSGKGTQGKILAEKFGMKTFETGAELRKLAQSSSPLGQKVKSIIEAGELVSDEVVMDVIENFLRQVKEGEYVIFDGIPRRESQQVLFDNVMERVRREAIVVHIDLSKESALQRLSTRKVCEKCKTSYPAFYNKEVCEEEDCGGTLVKRSDDNVESIQKRLDTYETETIPVIENYRAKSDVLSVNGELNIEEVSMEILKGLKDLV